jgi:TolB-like protein/DNA-binding winged helix-turn-helix (wHTH) protein/Tfp pilus assembly protein PilF
MAEVGLNVFCFEGYTLDLTRGCVRNANGEIELRPKSFELLSYLVANAGRLISKDELVNAVWPNVIVSDDSLAQCVSDLRHALSDADRRIIKTVPRRGYLFDAPISVGPRHPAIARSFDRTDQEYSIGEGLSLDPPASSQQGHMRETRRLAAILAADVVGYSRLIGVDEGGTLRALKAIRAELFDPAIAAHNGRLVKTTGDGLLVEFGSVVDALRCATQFQERNAEHNKRLPADKRIEFRMGVHQGDIIVEDGDIFGDGVNIAVRLEGLAQSGGICVSARVQEDALGKLDLMFEDLGEQQLKNISRPVRVHRVLSTGARTWPEPRAVTAPRLSIVVLPFANLSNDPDQEYFADAITDDLTTDLSRISGSFVIARTTAFSYKGKPVDVRQIGRELGIRYVIEGSVRRGGDQILVNVQLVDAERGAHVWAERFETDRRNLAGAESEITGRLARTLNLELVHDSGRRVELERAVDPDARDLVMRGWAWYYRPSSKARLREARRDFERALEVDPRSVEARIGIATSLLGNISSGWSSSAQQDKARAEQLLLEALEQDTNRSMAHVAMGILRRLQARLSESKMEFETAIALDRNNARAIFQLGQTMMWLGQPEAGIPLLERAIRLNPHDPTLASHYAMLGSCHLLLGHVDQALDLLRRARAENPRTYYIHLYLAGALGFKGDLDEAKAALAESLKLNPEINSFAAQRAQAPYHANPLLWALREKTLNVGLRRIGFPEE